MKTEHLDWLAANDACNESIEWVEENKTSSLEDAWSTCERGDWLLWLASKLGVDKRKLTLCGALCAHTVVQYMEDPRSRNTVRIAFLYSRGKATLDELNEARVAAWAAADDADTTSAASAAYAAARAAAYAANTDVQDADAAAAWAAYAAWTVAYDAAAYASDAAWTVAYDAATFAAAWDAADAAEKEHQRKNAEIARRMLTNEVLQKIKEIR